MRERKKERNQVSFYKIRELYSSVTVLCLNSKCWVIMYYIDNINYKYVSLTNIVFY